MTKTLKIAIYSHSIAPSIDGVCRRFTGLLREMVALGHEVLVFTLEDHPEDLPPNVTTITLDHMCVPSYPEKKVARPTIRSFNRMLYALKKHRPDVIHVTADGFSHMFALLGLVLNIPILGSFHTDLMDLLQTHNAHPFQSMVVALKERIDSRVFDASATTSTSFAAKLKTLGVHCDFIIQTAVDTTTFNSDKKCSALRKEMMFGDESGFLCVYVGRISKEKRIDIMWEALQGEHNYMHLPVR